MNGNYSHRRDDRTDAEFAKNIKDGVRLQKQLGIVMERQLKRSWWIKSLGFTRIDCVADDQIHTGDYNDGGDATAVFGIRSIALEFKHKEIDSSLFSLKQEDLVRCIEKGKPIVMANRMASNSSMIVRSMGLHEIKRLLEYPAKSIQHFGGKFGYVFDESEFDGWISAEETDGDVIQQCYSNSLLGLFVVPVPRGHVEYSWEATRKAAIESERAYKEAMAIACANLGK